jgi:hypothetical protein
MPAAAVVDAAVGAIDAALSSAADGAWSSGRRGS